MSTDKSFKHSKSKDKFLIANVSNYFEKHSGRDISSYSGNSGHKLLQVSQFILPPGQLAPRGASCPRISCPPPWLSSPPGGKLSRPVYLAPRPTQVKIYTCYFVIFLYHFNEVRSSISHKVRNWCLWG